MKPGTSSSGLRWRAMRAAARVRGLVIALITFVACIAPPCFAQALSAATADGPPFVSAPGTPRVALAQRLGAALPLAARFTASDGRALQLADEFGAEAGRPVILVLGYYRCPQLCGLLMQGLLEATRATGLPPADYRIVFVSIDPQDTPADAAARRQVDLDYDRFLDGAGLPAGPPALDLLVGPADSVEPLARAVGYVYQPAATSGSADRFAHPAGIVVLTPAGHVSRYLMGVRFDPNELRDALVEAADGRIGTLTDRLALLCAHLDPRLGRWTVTVLQGMRVLGLATLALLAWLMWRLRARRADEPEAPR